MNEKLMAASFLFVSIVGGTLTNLYIFSTSTSLFVRIFSTVVFILVAMPLIVSLIAYLKGRRELSKKLIDFS